MKKRMMKICYIMTLAAVLCTSGTTGVTGIKSVYAAENESQKTRREQPACRCRNW